MHRYLYFSLMLGLASAGGSFAQRATLPTTSLASAASLPAPRFSSTGGVTRSVLDLPSGASYSLTPTFAGMRIDVRGATATFQSASRPTPQLSSWNFTPTSGGLTVLFSTPYPLGLNAGWRAFELPALQGSGHRLVIEFAASLQGGVVPAPTDPASAAASVSSTGAPEVPATPDSSAGAVQSGDVSAASLPPGDAVAPVAVATPAPVRPVPDPVAAVAAQPKAAAPAPAAVAQSQGSAASLPTPSAPLSTPVSSAPVTLPGTAGQGGVVLTAPRVGKNPGSTRMVLDLPAGTSYVATPGQGGLSVLLSGVQAQAASASGVSGELSGWRYTPTASGVTVLFQTPYPLGVNSGWRVQVLPPGTGSARPRLVFDFSPAYADLTPLTAAQRVLAPVRSTAVLQASLPAGQTASAPVASAPQVVIDPGHGGVDPGAIGAVVEKQVTLAVGLKVRDILQSAGIRVVMTRTTDTDLSDDKDTDLKARGQLGSAPSVLYVSIHVNSMEKNVSLRGYGVETWWYHNNPGSQALAQKLQQDVISETGTFSRGLQTGRALAVLRYASVPAALVEIGFTSHPVDGLNLESNNYLDRVAMGIAQGIRDSLPGQ